METASTIVQLLGVLGFGTVLTAIVVAVSSRKKIGAEATEKITAAAGDQLDNMREELVEARKTAREERSRANRIDSHNRGWWSRADTHSAWDREMLRRAREAGIECDPPPPLYPLSGD